LSSSKGFVKLCSVDEVQRTILANAIAPEQTLQLTETFASHKDGWQWALWPKLEMDGYDAVVFHEKDLDAQQP
jgi:hypothetical protein